MRKVRPVRVRLVVLVLLLVVVGAGAALAGRGDPRERINPADQRRAQAMLIRASDVSVAFTAAPRPRPGSDFYCAAVDESDLVLTGVAWSPNLTSTAEFLSSTSYVYASRRDANTSWKRGTSPAGERCVRRALRGQIRGTGVQLLSFGRMAFPERAQRSIAYRAVASQQGIRIYLDIIAMQHSRAQTGIVYGSALAPPPRPEELRVSALVAKRMAVAMRGA